MFGHHDNRLSLAASAVWRTRFNDPMDEWAMSVCPEVGPLIAAHDRSAVLAAIKEQGFTPGSYNEALRERLCGDEYPHMSYRVYTLLSFLEVENVCPECGAALDVKTFETRNYGGGYDTFVRCSECEYGEVYV